MFIIYFGNVTKFTKIIDIITFECYYYLISHKQEAYIMKKRKLLSVIFGFLMLFTVLSVFAGSSSFNEPLGSGYWSGALSVIDTVVSAETNLDPIPPTINLSAGVSGTVWFVDYYGNQYYTNYSEYQDYVTGVTAVIILPSGFRRFVVAESYHYGYINGSYDNSYLSASN